MGFEPKFDQIEEWLTMPIPAEQNTPLIITSKKGHGKKLFLVKWIQHHLSKNVKVS